MATPDSSQHPDGKKNDKHPTSPKSESNLSGLKHALHGTSYQLKLGIVVCLANAKKFLDPSNDFSFTVTAEDPTAGKFDDIVYAFKDGTKAGVLKIQVQHKLGASTVPNITWSEITTTSDTKNPFAILKYFASFCDQQQSTTDLEGFIICTNSDIEDKAKEIWKTVETAATGGSKPSLDSYVLSLFDNIGGKCYQLDYDKLYDGTLSHFYQLLRKCSKRTRLAKLMIEATKPNKKIAANNSLFKEYRQAILNVIDRSEPLTNDLYGFTKDFLVSSSSNSNTNYEAFKKEFEDQYRQEFKIDGCVWDDLKLKRVHVAKDFLVDEQNVYASSDSFPADNVDKYLKSFCERFRLVCGTYNEQGLDDAIAKLWKNLHFGNQHLGTNQRIGRVEENMVTDRLFKTNFDWLMNPSAKPLHSDDIKKSLENIEGILTYMKLKPISDKLRKKIEGSPFRLSAKVLGDSELYKQVQTESLLEIEAFDIQFGVTVLLDILDLDDKESIFLEESDFLNNSKKVNRVLPPLSQQANCLVVICNGMGTVSTDIFKGSVNQVILIKKTNDISSVLSSFCLSHLTEASWEQFLRIDIPLCGTAISSSKIFQNNFRELPIEEVIKLLVWGNQLEENNDISKKYREIECTYVHRPWIDEKMRLEAENICWSKEPSIIKSLKNRQQKEFSFMEITKLLKNERNFVSFCSELNNPEKKHEAIVGDEDKKVLILLGEAGFGKSTSMTWLACDLRKRNPSSWVIRCNLSDHCSVFKPFTPGLQNDAGKLIDETEAVKMLYKLIFSSLQLERKKGEKCSKCLVFLHGEALVTEELANHQDLSLKNSIQLLVFKEKYNAGELILLLDGFDEIAPHYKEVVLMFLSLFEQFKGVGKMYLTSRPYDFKELFEKAFKDPSFFQLKPLSVEDKGFILYKMMKVQWHNGNIGDQDVKDFYKSLCFMLLCSLGSMSDVPLNLMMAVDILEDHVYQNGIIIHSSKTFNVKLFETILNISKASFIVEEFVKVKIRHLLYDKNGGDKNVADKPSELEKFEKAIDEAKVLHGLMALRVLFSDRDRRLILSDIEMRQTEAYSKKLQEGSEKTGIIHTILDGRINFIHRTFVEYLAAWWVIQRQRKEKRESTMNISRQASFWDREREELRVHIDRILAKNHPLNLAIIEKDWRTVESLLSTNPKSFYERDDGNRTPLHLLAFYYDFNEDWPQFLPDPIESEIINCKENLFAWTALDNMFLCINAYESTLYDQHNSDSYHRFIFYLLHHGASINVDVLYEQVVSSEFAAVRKSAKYSRYVMEYLSRQEIKYELHDACKKMKRFCDKVVAYLINETSANLEEMVYSGRYTNYNEDVSIEKKIITEFISKDSVWMLESLIKQKADMRHFFEMLKNSYIELAVQEKSIFIVTYFMANDPSILIDEQLWKCTVYAALRDYKVEFKYFFDLYCTRIKIKDFQSCSIQNDEAYYVNNCFESYVMEYVCDIMDYICWAKLETLAEITIEKDILSLLVICAATVRTSMLRYMKETCNLKLSAGLVYSLAMITNNLFWEIDGAPAINPRRTYGCLLDLASNISGVEVNKMLRLAITSKLFDFAKCLIERYNIDLESVDELKDWIVFHLCVAYQHSFWINEMIRNDDFDYGYVERSKIVLFRYMLEKGRDIDCFDDFDKKGRSILHLAIENEQANIVEHIVARKLGLNNLKEIENIESVNAIPDLTFLYGTIQEISKSVGEKWWHYKLLWVLAKQIAKIEITIQEELENPNNGKRLFIEQHAAELYQIALKCQFLFLMCYLSPEFPKENQPLIYDASWLTSTVINCNSSDSFDVTKYLLNLNQTDEQVDLYKIVNDDFFYEACFEHLNEIVKDFDAKLSPNRSMEELCILYVLALAVLMKAESMIKCLCETLDISWQMLIDIMVIVHRRYMSCDFDKYNFESIYKYLFERTSNLDKIDAEGRNVLHLAAQSGLGCMAKFLINNNMFNVMTTNKQNGWNSFHYYASSKRWSCCDTKNDTLWNCLISQGPKIQSDVFWFVSLRDRHLNQIKELCFNSNKRRKSLIYIAVEAGNIESAQTIIEFYLGIKSIDDYKIKNTDERSRFRECYDELSIIATQFPFNAKCDYLLHNLGNSIHRFSPENIKHVTEQENVSKCKDNIVEDVLQTAIMYRSLKTLEHLLIACEDQMNQSLAKNSNNELISCMMECIRRNRINMFRVLVSHFRTLKRMQHTLEVQFEVEENENVDQITIDERKIQWSIIDEFTRDVVMKQDILSMLILSFAYGRLSITRYLVEMLQLEVNKSLIVSIIKASKELCDENCEAVMPVYEYLARMCEGNPNLLHLSAEAGCYNMFKYLIKDKKLDPNEVNSENGWTTGHYFVSEPAYDANQRSDNVFKVIKLLMEMVDMDCFGVLDRSGRSILHLAIENGYTRVVIYIINHRLGLKDGIYSSKPWNEWDLQKIENHIDELQQILGFLSENLSQQKQKVVQDILEKVNDRKGALTTYYELFTNQT